MLDLTSTNPGSGTEQLNEHISLHGLGTSSSNRQNAITSWMSQEFPADLMEVLTAQAFPTSLGEHESKNNQGQDNLFTNMDLLHESDNNCLILNSTNSSTLLYPFSDSALTSDVYDTLWSSTNLSPALSEGVSLMQDSYQSESDANAWSTRTKEGSEGAKSSSTAEIPSTMKLTKMGKTVLTLENLDSETRRELLDLLCKRKIITTIEIV